MAEPEPIIFPTKKQTSNPNIPSPKTPQNQQSFISSFHYKTIFIIILIVLLPLFPSQAPDSLNSSLLSRGWELIHLLLVGVAISYGLFSRRNSDPDVEKPATDSSTPQSYVSKLLLSSVFDDDDHDEKIQTWSSQYQPVSPVVVVDDADDKPLSLPVRNLKSTDSLNKSDANFISEYVPDSREKESVVLPSPIPWRSRSGRMEVKEETLAQPSPVSASIPKQEEYLKKKKVYKSTPPPAPPPPPPLPHLSHAPPKPVKSLKEELKDISEKPSNNPTESITPSTPPRSVRTVRWKNVPNKVEKAPLVQPEEVIVTTDDDSDSDDEAEKFDAEDASSSAVEGGIDKKADEFIAKFREQIRLQRIESIKRTSGQRNVKKA